MDEPLTTEQAKRNLRLAAVEAKLQAMQLAHERPMELVMTAFLGGLLYCLSPSSRSIYGRGLLWLFEHKQQILESLWPSDHGCSAREVETCD